MPDGSAEFTRFVNYLKEIFQKYGKEVLSELGGEDENADKTESGGDLT